MMVILQEPQQADREMFIAKELVEIGFKIYLTK